MSKKKRSETRPSKQQHAKHKPAFFERHSSVLPLLLLAVLLMVFFSEVMFFGKTYLPPDTLASRSIKPFIDSAFSNGQYPLWNPYIFCGMPSFASLQSAPLIDVIGDVIRLIYLPLSWLPFGDAANLRERLSSFRSAHDGPLLIHKFILDGVMD